MASINKMDIKPKNEDDESKLLKAIRVIVGSMQTDTTVLTTDGCSYVWGRSVFLTREDAERALNEQK